jgi:hypothetical protein
LPVNCFVSIVALILLLILTPLIHAVVTPTRTALSGLVKLGTNRIDELLAQIPDRNRLTQEELVERLQKLVETGVSDRPVSGERKPRYWADDHPSRRWPPRKK